MLKPTFWQETEAKIGIAVAAFPPALLHKQGSQGLLDMAITEAVSGDLKTYLKQLDLSDFTDVDGFIQEFEEKGFVTKKITQQINSELFPEYTAPSSGKYSKIDFRGLAAKEDIDLLLLLSVERVGTIRSYYGFIPLSKPKAFCHAKGQLVELKSNQIIWMYNMNEAESTIEVIGEWDMPPDYPDLSKAMKRALANAKEILADKVFN